MPASPEVGFAFCELLHERLAAELSDAAAVHARVSSLLPVNSFRESCFCKGCVLPVVDTLTTAFLCNRYAASRDDAYGALRCEGFQTPMYTPADHQVGFSSHSRSNSYHPGDKSGRRARSRRSPDFCIRFGDRLRMVGEVKYVGAARGADSARLVHELRDYLSIAGEPTSDWGHDFGYGLIYEFGRGGQPKAVAVSDHWQSDHIFITRIGCA